MKAVAKTLMLFVGLLLVITAWSSQGQADTYVGFDFESKSYLNAPDGDDYYTQPEYISVKTDQIYEEGVTPFGWQADPSDFPLPGRDRGGSFAGDPLSDLHRDLHFDDQPQTFSVDLPNGDYKVILHFYDKDWEHDNIQVHANGDLVFADVDVPQGGTEPVIREFDITITTGRLDLRFSDPLPLSDPNDLPDDPNLIDIDPNWIISGVGFDPHLSISPTAVVPLPGAVLLLASGLLRLGLMGLRRKNS
jgi:hypothetical protein